MTDQATVASSSHEEDVPITFYYKTSELFEQKFRKLPGTSLSFTMRLQNLEKSSDIQATIAGVLKAVLHKASQDFGDADKLGVQIRSANLERPILIPFTEKRKLTPEKIMILTEKVGQSKTEFKLDEEIEMQVTGFKTQIKGGAFRNSRCRGVWDRWYDVETKKRNGCLLKILNDDELCGPKALILAAYFAWKKQGVRETVNKYRRLISSMKKPHLQYLDQETKEWIEAAGMEDHEGQWSVEDLAKLENAKLQPNMRLKIISKSWVDSCVYEGEKRPDQQVIHLYHHDDHFSVIKSMTGFYNTNYYCESCNVAYYNKAAHPCTAPCRFCGANIPCKLDGLWLECNYCWRFFPSEECRTRHREGNPSICGTIHRCVQCNNYYDPEKRHLCWLKHCKKCDVQYNEKTEGVHYCFITKVLQRKAPRKRNHSRAPLGPAAKVRRRYRFIEYPENFCEMTNDQQIEALGTIREEHMEFDYDSKKSFIFFDIESQQDQNVGETPLGPKFQHRPNLIIAFMCCTTCKDDEVLPCPQCKKREHKFDTMDQFCRWLFSHKGVTAIAHNAKAYDSQFILQFIHAQGILPKVIPRGLNLLCIEAAGVRIIDSHSFLPMALAKLPSAFNLKELKKGYFPHLFNRADNQDYNDKMPKAEHFMPDQMTPAAREKFFTWYRANKDKNFNLKKELEEYCRSDVDILMRGCMAFRDLFFKETRTDPFNKITIASACMNVYRRNFLKGNKIIGLVPPQGYSKNDVQSRIGTIWLEWMAQENKEDIQHAKNGGEATIFGMKLDGLCRCCHEHAYEFNGCLWHGCPKCFKNRDHKLPNSVITVEMAHQMWLRRKEKIERNCSRLIYAWECDVRHQLAHNPRMAAFFKKCPVAGPMHPREGLYGGRTNAVTLHHVCKPGEQISYIDVVSLYPYVMKTGMYPLRHPEIHKTDIRTYSAAEFRRRCQLPKPQLAGLWKIKILPPQDLFHPVLPYKSGSKLLFPLCRTCGETRNIADCSHTEEERALTGVWTHLEIQKALDLGYLWLESSEAWLYEEMDQLSRTNYFGLFSEYINTFLKLKLEASGWPSGVQTEEEKDEFIRIIKEKEGIKMDKQKVAFNPGLRQVSKLMLNSLWGKFAQRTDNPNPIYLKSVDEFLTHITNPTQEVHSVVEISPELYQITVKPMEEYEEGHAASNPVLASYVTSQARLLLYSYLEKLQERVLYFDTDSIIYLTRPGEEKIKTGSFLGEMTDELEEYGQGAYIQEFASAGPKNYAFKTINDAGESRTVTKIRGFSLAYSASLDLNFLSLKRMVQAFVESGGQEEVTIQFPQIKRNKKGEVFTVTSKKSYRVTYDKRRVLRDSYTTVPYGFKML